MTDESIRSFIVDAQGLGRCPCCAELVCIACTAREGHVVTHPNEAFTRQKARFPNFELQEEEA